MGFNLRGSFRAYSRRVLPALFLFGAATGLGAQPLLSGEEDEASDAGRPLSIREILLTWTNEYSTLQAPPPADTTIEDSDPLLKQYLQEGFQQLSVKEYGGAETSFQKALVREPNFPRALFGLATLYIETSRYADAEKIFSQLIQDEPDNYRLLNNLAWMYATAEDAEFRNAEKAVSLAQKALLQAPEDYHVWSTVAEAHYQAGHYGKAERAAFEALRLVQISGKETRQLHQYKEQLERCRNAARALSVID